MTSLKSIMRGWQRGRQPTGGRGASCFRKKKGTWFDVESEKNRSKGGRYLNTDFNWLDVWTSKGLHGSYLGATPAFITCGLWRGSCCVRKRWTRCGHKLNFCRTLHFLKKKSDMQSSTDSNIINTYDAHVWGLGNCTSSTEKCRWLNINVTRTT